MVILELEKDNYSKEEVTEILKGYDTKIEDYTSKLNDSNTKLADADNQKEQIDSLTKSNLENSIKVEMLKNGLSEDMFDLVEDSTDIESALKKITKLVEIKKKSVIDNSYKPREHNQTNSAYEDFRKKGNVEGMLKSKINKIFNK